jgi:hypothetical protein
MRQHIEIFIVEDAAAPAAARWKNFSRMLRIDARWQRTAPFDSIRIQAL